MKVCAAPIIAATLPGKRYAARNSSGKNAPKLSSARTALFHHHEPLGSWRESATITKPTGSDRTTESSNGRSGARTWVVSR